MISHNCFWGQKRLIIRLLYYCGCLTVLFCCTVGSPCLELSKQCDLSSTGSKLTCSGRIHTPYINDSNSITALVLCNWPSLKFDPHLILKQFPSLEEISVVQSKITTLTSTFENGLSLRKINISGLHIRTISKDIFHGLHYVRSIDLRHNRLQHIDEEVLSRFPHLEEVFLADNEWLCKFEMAWILNTSLVTRLKDLNQLTCSNYDRKPILLIMKLLKTMELQCPAECICILDHVTWTFPVTATLVPIYIVNCSHRGLKEFPSKLPENTTKMLLQGNKIESVAPLAINPYYSQVTYVYLDNNLIKSINVLEGSNWLYKFHFLSLKENLITEIPIYALDDVFAKNSNLGLIFLGHNPWICECTFVLSFQELMKKYSKVFADISNIRCAYAEGDDDSLLAINTLPRSAVCKEPINGLDRLTGLDILNISLASLIVLILGKLLYDYFTFKKTGKLPWIVMKMP